MYKIFLLIFLSLYSNILLANQGRQVIRPQNIEQTDFYLITVESGADLYMRFGHSILRMVDKERGLDYALNWGIFDFDAPNFAWNFFRGKLPYLLGVGSVRRTISMYKFREKRKVYQDKLNLTTLQKSILIDKIMWNLRPENRRYAYQHFYNNCSTKIRDYLNLALNSYIKNKTSRTLAGGLTFRDYIRSYLNRPPIIGTSLDILMNNKLDYPISLWEEMFLPLKLRDILFKIPALNDQGEIIPGQMLLSKQRVLVKNPLYPSPKTNLYHWLLLLTGLPTITSLIFFLRRKEGPAYFAMGLSLLLAGLLGGAFGSTMLISWIFSEHKDLLHNANLWLFWPTDLIFIWYGTKILFRKSALFVSQGMAKFLNLSFISHILAMMTVTLLKLTGVIEQDISRVLIYILPQLTLLYIISFRFGFKAHPEKEA